MSLKIKAKIESFYISLTKYKKVYITAKTAAAIIHDNEAIVDKQLLIKLNYKFDDKFDMSILMKKGVLIFTADTEYEDYHDNHGHELKQFNVSEIKCVE